MNPDAVKGGAHSEEKTEKDEEETKDLKWFDPESPLTRHSRFRRRWCPGSAPPC